MTVPASQTAVANCGCFGEATPTSDYGVKIVERSILLAIGLALFAAAWISVRRKAHAQVAEAAA